MSSRMRSRGNIAGWVRTLDWRILLLSFVASLAMEATAEAQSRGSIEGFVLEESTGAPIAGAVLSVAGRSGEVKTDDSGHFTLSEVPSGLVTVRVVKKGYPTVVEQVEAGTPGSSTARILLPRIDATLDAMIVEVTGAPDEPRARDEKRTALDLLADFPGVVVGAGSGGRGLGANVTIRGVGTFQGNNFPAIFLDGVRVDGGGPRPTPMGRGNALGILELIPASQVARIQVLRGPAAASVQAGAAGAILIETVKGGGAAEPR